MKRYFYIALFITLSHITFAEGFRFSAYGGYAFFSMNDLKDLQNSMVTADLPFEGFTNVEEFPANHNFLGAIEYEFDQNAVGVNFTYYSTGARSHIQDYSGEYRIDMITNGMRFGAHYKKKFEANKMFDFYIQFRAGIISTEFRLEDFFRVEGLPTSSNNYEFKGTSFWGEPSIGGKINLPLNISLELNIGYMVDAKGNLYLDGNKDYILQDDDGSSITTDWSGLKILGGITFIIPSNN